MASFPPELPPSIRKLPPEAQADILRELIKEAYRDSLFLTARHLLGYRDITPHTHGEMIATLESEGKRKIIVMPRGTFKSSVSSIALPIWSLLKDSELRILLDSEIYSNSKNFLREIKMHLMGERLVSLFGRFEKEPWNEGEILIAQRKRLIKEASITASGIGAEKTGQHYDLIICDDLNSPSNSGTSEGRAKVIDHYRYLNSILEPHGTMVIVGTRYAADDVIGFILRNEVEL